MSENAVPRLGMIDREYATELSVNDKMVDWTVHPAILPRLVEWLNGQNWDLVLVSNGTDESLPCAIVSPKELPMKAKGYIIVEGVHNQAGTRVVRIRLSSSLTKHPPNLKSFQEAIEIEVELPDDYFDSQHQKVSIVMEKPDPVDHHQTVHVKPKARSKAAAAIHIDGVN